MLGLILGVFVVLLGLKAFSPNGIPFTKETSLTGIGAKIIGVVLIIFGVAMFIGGVLSAISVFT